MEKIHAKCKENLSTFNVSEQPNNIIIHSFSSKVTFLEKPVDLKLLVQYVRQRAFKSLLYQNIH